MSSITSEQRAALIDSARDARMHAYCPYSGFAVGAAVLTDTGNIFSGSNVENASYGLTICAERAAIFAAASAGFRRIHALAVVTNAAIAAAPCGACRQVAWEFAVPDYSPGLVIYLAGSTGGEISSVTLAELLPRPFGPADLSR